MGTRRILRVPIWVLAGFREYPFGYSQNPASTRLAIFWNFQIIPKTRNMEFNFNQFQNQKSIRIDVELHIFSSGHARVLLFLHSTRNESHMSLESRALRVNHVSGCWPHVHNHINQCWLLAARVSRHSELLAAGLIQRAGARLADRLATELGAWRTNNSTRQSQMQCLRCLNWFSRAPRQSISGRRFCYSLA